MDEFTIDRLTMRIEIAADHEHRGGPVAERAAAIFARRVGERFARSGHLPRSSIIEDLDAPAVSIDWRTTSDQQAADRIAAALLEALALKLAG
jgi:hypothetical protein